MGAAPGKSCRSCCLLTNPLTVLVPERQAVLRYHRPSRTRRASRQDSFQEEERFPIEAEAAEGGQAAAGGLVQDADERPPDNLHIIPHSLLQGNFMLLCAYDLATITNHRTVSPTTAGNQASGSLARSVTPSRPPAPRSTSTPSTSSIRGARTASSPPFRARPTRPS